MPLKTILKKGAGGGECCWHWNHKPKEAKKKPLVIWWCQLGFKIQWPMKVWSKQGTVGYGNALQDWWKTSLHYLSVSSRPNTNLCYIIPLESCLWVVHITSSKMRFLGFIAFLTCSVQKYLCIVRVIDKQRCLKWPNPERNSTWVFFDSLHKFLERVILQ